MGAIPSILVCRVPRAQGLTRLILSILPSRLNLATGFLNEGCIVFNDGI